MCPCNFIFSKLYLVCLASRNCTEERKTMLGLVAEKFQDVNVPDCAPDGSFRRGFRCSWFACYCQYEDGTKNFHAKIC